MYTLQHRIFFVSNLASRLFCTFPLSLYLLHHTFFFLPLHFIHYIHTYIGTYRERKREKERNKKRKNYSFSTRRNQSRFQSPLSTKFALPPLPKAPRNSYPLPLFPRDSIQKHGGEDAHPVSHDERIMNVLCANIFSTLPINVTANRQYNYAFQLMKQSPPRPCYLSSRVVFRREMATT